MKKTAVIVSLLLAAFVVGCTTTSPGLASGAGTANAIHGELSCNYLFGIFPMGKDKPEFTIANAAEQANIKHIATVDFKKKSILGVWVTRTIMITGN
ncbi:MAG: TRL-like family protein [Treponemataceae bacterium]|nr:TRL-like family protein [Treponemataceae bacterium]MDE6719762.1 TRL-like family protein [Treponemataceae bacterium]